jgi:hypothetical protein
MRFYKKFFRKEYPGILMWLVALGVWLRFILILFIQSARGFVKSISMQRG